ncbi:MAG: hypothetical protein ACR2NR_12515 [Solirubrobacteraceae bacterium]
MSTRTRSILIGFADALAAPEVAASLLAAGYRVAGFTRRGKPTPLRYLDGVDLVPVTPPERDVAACADEIAAAAQGHDVTMPLDDVAVLLCDRALGDDSIVAGPRGRQAELALDKRLQLEAAEAAGFDVPEWLELAAGERLPDGWTMPTVLKPALAVEELGGRMRRLSPRVIAGQGELDAVRESWGEATRVLVQRRMNGTGAGLFGLADATGVHHLSAHRRVRMMNPAGSGSSACASAQVSPELVAPVQRFLGDADWQGMFMVEFLRSGTTCWFMELNGRAWGSLALSRRLGYEYPAWSVARALDANTPLPDSPRFQSLLCRNLGREVVHLLFVLRGPHSDSVDWPGRWSTLSALSQTSRGTTWYNLGPGGRRLFLYDAWRTVVDQTVGRRR